MGITNAGVQLRPGFLWILAKTAVFTTSALDDADVLGQIAYLNPGEPPADRSAARGRRGRSQW